LQIDRILYPVQSLGPGKRIVIWTIGCYKRCPNCASPELWKFDKKKDISVKQILKLVASIDEQVDGITITGGEPFCQIEELSILLDEIRNRLNSKDYIVVSYQMEQQNHQDVVTYQVSMVIKARRNDDGGLFLLLREFQDDIVIYRIE
jgi:organic radical activating enzyme